LAETKVALADATKDGGSQIVHLEHRADRAGDFEYMVEVLPRDDESNVDNNRITRRVVVRDDIVRVLLVQAYPSYEFRFLKQVLVRELNSNQPAESKAAGLRTVLQEADVSYDATDKSAQLAFPASREELFQYDVLIFGDVNPSLLSRSMMNNIYEFVTVRGGGVIFIAGPRYTPQAYQGTPIASLLPIDVDSAMVSGESDAAPEGFRPQLTALGRSSPMLQLADNPTDNDRLWSDQLAPLHWLLGAGHVRPGVRVLVEHPTQRMDSSAGLPVISLQFVGAGKVVFHATDETYRWRFRTGDVYFARYWLQAIRYLCRLQHLPNDRDVELTTDREEYRRGDAVDLRVRFLDDRLAPERDDAVTVAIEDETQHRHQVTLYREGSERGIFAGSAGPLADGDYTARLISPALSQASAAIRFRVTAPPDELARTTADYAELRQAAEISRGKSYTFATANKLLSDLPPPHKVRVKSLPAVPIWNSWIVAMCFVAMITVEWLVRRQLSLL
jgi:hypothetical protein